MNGNAAYKQYKQVQVKTANSGKLLLMLYQGCVKFLRLAKKGIQEEDIEMANDNIIKSQNIIMELMNTLNREKGGEIADNLYNLYHFMNRQLVQANIKKEIEPLETVEDMMLELLASWQQIVGGKNKKSKKPQLNLKS